MNMLISLATVNLQAFLFSHSHHVWEGGIFLFISLLFNQFSLRGGLINLTQKFKVNKRNAFGLLIKKIIYSFLNLYFPL